MTNPVTARIRWKEYRTLRVLWLAVCGGGILTMLAIALQNDLAGNGPMVHEVFVFTAFVYAFCFAVGGSASLFANEHETGTYEWLRSLPIGAEELLLTKILTVFVLALALFGFLLFASYVPHTVNAWEYQASDVLILIVPLLEAVAWGTFWSLLTRKTLHAATLTGITIAIIVGLTSLIVYRDFSLLDSDNFWLRGFGAMVALGLAWRISSNWLTDAATVRWPSWIGFLPSMKRPDTLFGSPKLARHVWMWLRCQGALGISVLVLFVLGSMGFISSLLQVVDGSSFRYFEQQGALLAVFGIPIVGVMAFASEQNSDSRRFLVELGISPTLYWSIRQAVCLGTLVVTFLIVLGIVCWFRLGTPQPVPDLVRGSFVASLFLLHFYCLSQIWPMATKSTMVAVVAAWLSALALGIFSLVCFHFMIPFWINPLPLSVALLVATCWYCGPWLGELGQSRTKWRLALPVPVFLLTCIAICTFRLVEVPRVPPSATWADLASRVEPAALATADAYRRLDAVGYSSTSYRNYEDMLAGAWTAGSSDEGVVWGSHGIAEYSTDCESPTMRSWRSITERQDCAFIDFSERFARLSTPATPVGLVHSCEISALEIASKKLAAGELAEAWEWYQAVLRFCRHLRQNAGFANLHEACQVEILLQIELVKWASHPDQSAELLKRASVEYQRLADQQPAISDAYRVDYLKRVQLLEELPKIPRVRGVVDSELAKWYSDWMPWEVRRRIRIEHQLARMELELLDGAFNSAQPSVTPLAANSSQLLRDGEVNLLHYFQFRSPAYWAAESRRYNTLYTAMIQLIPDQVQVATAFYDHANCVQSRHAVITSMAILAWKLEHGQIPKTLAEVAADRPLGLPNDPYTREPFEYLPQGLPSDIGLRLGTVGYLVPARHPLLIHRIGHATARWNNLDFNSREPARIFPVGCEYVAPVETKDEDWMGREVDFAPE